MKGWIDCREKHKGKKSVSKRDEKNMWEKLQSCESEASKAA
jgi:hypothetical protein